jgi:hypothetical protein
VAQDIRYADSDGVSIAWGEYALKGVPGAWRLLAVAA